MTKLVSINTEIIKALRQYRINIDEAKLYLLGIYFDVDTQYINEKTRKQVNALNILERDYSTNENKIRWRVPLFNEEKSDAFDWIDQWMDRFKRINPHRRGTRTSVMSRMKKFFSAHPEVRVEDVFKATEEYFKTVQDPQYLKSSHKFIYEGSGFNLHSMLEQYVILVRESNKSDGRSSKMRG